MNTLSYKTVSANKKTVNKEWVVVDAQGEILGRLTSRIAAIIRGKHKPGFTPNVDCGDNVIVINADKVKLTGNKFSDKQYVSYTGYPGGQRFISPKELMAKHPTRVMNAMLLPGRPPFPFSTCLFLLPGQRIEKLLRELNLFQRNVL